MAVATGAKSTRRERWAWYLYDFGNSAYAAVVLLTLYSTYFKDGVVGGAEGSRLWGIAVGIAMLVVAVTAPVLGTLADFSASKKRFLGFFTGMACLFTATLFFVQEGSIVLGMLFFILAEVGYRSAQVFYNALLPEIADQEEMGRISGNGWAIGSAGGVLCLLLVLIPVQMTDGDPLVVRLAFIFTAVFYAVSALPIFFRLRERAKPQTLPASESHGSLAVRRLKNTFKEVRSFREFIKFVIAFLIYNDGIMMILDFGAILGATLFGMEQQELITFMIIVQVTSVVGAYLFGLVASSLGNKRALIVSLVLTIAPVIWLYFSYSITEFYIIGGLAGLALTGVQSVSRAMVGQLAPAGKSAEFYGFFALSGRTSSFIGPAVFGLLVKWAADRYQETQQMTALAAEEAGHRVALFSIVAFLAVGLVLLYFVNESKGRAAAAAE